MLNFNLYMIQELLHHTSTLFRGIGSKCSCHSRIIWVAFEPLHYLRMRQHMNLGISSITNTS